MPDGAAGELAGGLVVFDGDLAVDEHQFGPRRPLQRLLIRGDVAEGGRIEDDNVSREFRLQITTLLQAKYFGRQSRGAVNRVGQRNNLALQRIAADFSRESAE